MASQKIKKYKVCRRLGPDVYDKCQTQKFALSEARHTRGTKRRRRKLSGYGTQLLAKQKVRFMYGVAERQFRNYVTMATDLPGSAAKQLYKLLETRLDNIVYRLGLANSRRFARQLVSHGHLLVNGTRVTIPSYQIKEGDTITIREGSKDIEPFTALDKRLKDHTPPQWLSFDLKNATGSVIGMPDTPEESLDLTSIIEFYSR